jgi:hypothetical protein
MRFDMAPLPFARSGKKFNTRRDEMKDIALPASARITRSAATPSCTMFIMAQRYGLASRVKVPSIPPPLRRLHVLRFAKILSTIWLEGEMKMSLPRSQPLFAPDEYLAVERDSEERHEWLDGLIYAMTGESIEHSTICMNLGITLGTQLKGKLCRVLSPNMRLIRDCRVIRS